MYLPGLAVAENEGISEKKKKTCYSQDSKRTQLLTVCNLLQLLLILTFFKADEQSFITFFFLLNQRRLSSVYAMVYPCSTVILNGKLLLFLRSKISSLQTVTSLMTESSPACISDYYKIENTICSFHNFYIALFLQNYRKC